MGTNVTEPKRPLIRPTISCTWLVSRWSGNHPKNMSSWWGQQQLISQICVQIYVLSRLSTSARKTIPFNIIQDPAKVSPFQENWIKSLHSGTSVRVGTAICTSKTFSCHSGCFSRNISKASNFCGMPLIMSSRSTPNMTYFTAKQKSESDSGIHNTLSQRYRKAQEKHIGTAKLIAFLPSLRANTNTTVRKRYTRKLSKNSCRVSISWILKCELCWDSNYIEREAPCDQQRSVAVLWCVA